MKKAYFTKPSLVCLLCVPILITCSCINIGSFINRAKYERRVELTAPLPPGSLFTATTHNGEVTINGANVSNCNLTATIIARALTKDDAKKLAEEIKIKLEPYGKKLSAKIEKPTSMRNRSVSVNLDVTIPNQTDLELTTHNGAIRIANITGEVNSTTHNGGVTVSQVSGNIKLQTHNGSITCKEISGDTQLRTHNGNVKVSYSESASPVCNVSMVTHNGGIDFISPPDFSAAVDVSTHNGTIKSDLPIPIKGEISKKQIKGTIGEGEGKLHLETYNGSIKIR